MTDREEDSGDDEVRQEGGSQTLRVDRWLWCTRLFKTRSQAAEAVAGGKVHLNGKRVKPAHPVRIGDHLSLKRPGFELECEVLKLPDRRGAAPIAITCYAETEATKVAREKFVEASRLASAFAPRSPDRPDKHGRRELRKLRGRD